MSKYIYSNKVASKRSLQSVNISDLMGVDYSTSMLNVSDKHATDINNFIKKNNVLQKRGSYKQVMGTTALGRVNGIWECYYKNKQIVIAHIDNSLYLVKDINNYYYNADNFKEIVTNADLIQDIDSFGFFTNDRLYILCGKYCVLKFYNDAETEKDFKLYEVYNDVDTYVPTTTINIGANESLIPFSRKELDAPNMLSSYRINTLNTAMGEGNEKTKCTFYLDSVPKLEFDDETGDLKTFFTLSIKYLENEKIESRTLRPFLVKDGSAVMPDGTTQELQSIALKTKVTDSEVYGYLGNRGTLDYLDKIELVKTYINPNQSIDNVKVKFEVESEDYKTINNCTFGVLYGAEGYRNRLFLSGNPNYPNVDFHSSRRNIYASTTDTDLLDNQDLTYFSVYDSCVYGTSNTAIVGYQIMGNSSLMVLKEHSQHEMTVYFRNAVYTQETINGESVTVERYPLETGNIGEGGIRNHKHTLQNLDNDIVFLSPNGIFGISSTITSNSISNDYRYAFSRSRLINKKLLKDIENSQSIATMLYDHKYFISIKKEDGTYITYVGDGRYKYALPDSIDNEYEYEWFVFSDIPADKFYKINENLFFTNNNGLFKFDVNGDNFKDIEQMSVVFGELISDYNNGIIINSADEWVSNSIKGDTKIVIPEEELLYVLVNNSISTNSYGVASINDSKTKDYFEDENNKLFIKGVGRIYVSLVEDEYEQYYIYTDEQKKTPLRNCSNKPLYNYAYAQEYKIVKNEDNVIKIYDIYNYEPIFVDNLYLTRTVSILGKLVNEYVVCSKYVTKSFNMGQSLYSKILRTLTLINDSASLSYVNMAINTKTMRSMFEDNYLSGTNGMSDTYLNLFNADLTEGSFSSSFTKNMLLKFNFIQFEFYNNDTTNCVINNLSITYTMGFKAIGVS